MTDRYHSLLVTLGDDIRSDDAEQLINAIKMLRGVAAVDGNVADFTTMAAYQRAKYELRHDLFKILE